MKIISAIIIALFIAVPAMADEFVVVTGDNEVSSIDDVQVAITYSPLTKTIAELYAEYTALQAQKAYLTELYLNAKSQRDAAIAEMASLVAQGGDIDARMASLVSLRDAILAAAADVVLKSDEPVE